MGEKQDVYILEKYLNYPSNQVCVAVLVGLHRLDPCYKTERYITGLQDDNAKIRQVCIELLRSNHPELTDAVRKVLLSRIHFTQIAALRVLVSYSGLEALRDIMLALFPRQLSIISHATNPLFLIG